LLLQDESQVKDSSDENESTSGNVAKKVDEVLGKKMVARELPADMTVEEFLQAECKKEVASVKSHAEMLVHKLKTEYKKMKEEFLAEVSAAASANDAKASQPRKVILTITTEQGTYEGQVFTVSVSNEKPAMVGRSRGKKFLPPVGLCLSRDQEVSTTHGKFELSESGELTYTDVGSTNSSFLGDIEVVQNEPTPIKEGDVLRVGSNFLKISITGKA